MMIRTTFLLPVLVMLFAAGAACAGQLEATGFYMKGSFSEHGGDLERAYAFYSRALTLDPGDPEIIFALARVTSDLGKVEEAAAYASQIRDEPSIGARAKLLLAELDYRSGEIDKAVSLFEEVKDAEGVPNFEIHKLLARIYLELEDTGRARRTLEEARDIYPGDLYVNYRLGFIYAEAGETLRAIESFRAAVEANPSVPNTHLALASMLIHEGDRQGAKESFRAAAELDPTNRNAVMDLVDLYYEDGEYEEGVELLESLRDSGRLDDDGMISLGRFYYRLERYEEALEVFREVLTGRGDNATILRVVSEIELKLGHFASAGETLHRLIELEPGSFDNYIGLLLISLGLAGEPSSTEQEASISQVEGRYFLKEAVKLLDSGSAADNYLIGTVYRKAGDLERAMHFLLEAERLEPGDRETALELASLFEDRGEYGKAIERVRGLHRDDPGDPSLSNFYGYLLAQKGEDLDLAERLLLEALEKEPDNGYFLDSLGWIKYRQGEYEEALEILLRAVETVGDDPVIWEHLGDTYLKLSRFSEAEDAYAKSLGIAPGKPLVQGKLEKAKKAGLDEGI